MMNMVGALALAQLLLTLLCAAAHASPAALSVTGAGVHTATAPAGHTAQLGDIASVLARIIGVDAHGLAPVPVAGDLFVRPRACVLLAVDGVSPNDLSEKDTPNLLALFQAHSLPLNDDKAARATSKIEAALRVRETPLSSLLELQFHGARLWATSQDAAPAKPYLYTVREGQSELQVFSDLLKASKASPTAPAVIVLASSSVAIAHGADAKRAALAQLDAEVPELLATAQEVHDGRAAAVVALLGEADEAHLVARRRTQASESGTSTNATAFYATEQIANYLLIVWTSVTLVVLLLGILLCCPWSDELDPILYSSLGKDDGKKDL